MPERGSDAPPRFVRLAETGRPSIALRIDGRPATALAGDTLLVALLSNGRRVRDSEFGGGLKGPASAEHVRAYVKPDNVLRQFRALRRFVPAFENVQPIRVWSGIEGYTSDWQPVMVPSAVTAGLHDAFGFNGEGFATSPDVGEAMAELIATGRTSTPIESFSVGRFATATAARAAA